MPSVAQEARRIGRTRPLVEVQGTALSFDAAEALSGLRIEHGYGLPGRATLRFHDVGMGLANSGPFQIGKEVRITPGDSAQSSRPLFTGFVTAVEFDMRAGGPVLRSTGELVVTLDDAVAKLAWSTDTVAALNQSPADVIKRIAQNKGVQVRVQGLSAPGPYHLQRGTGLAVIDDLVRRHGAVWWTDGTGQLNIAPTDSAGGPVSVSYGDQELLGFSLRANSRNPDTVEVTGWDPGQQKAIAVTSTPSSAAPGDRPFGRLEQWKTSVGVADHQPVSIDEAKVIAEGLRAESAAAAVVMTATCLFNPALAPHVKLEFRGAGAKLDGSYLLTHVEHVYSASGFETRVTSGPLRPSGLVDLLGPGGSRFEALGRSLVPAVVTDVASPENDGTVKVKFPTVDERTESAWARLVILGAGAQRGMVFYPEVNDEVLVGFENGDINRPIVLGGLHSSKNTFPFAEVIKDKQVAARRITSKQGHTLEFGEGQADGEQHVKLTSKKGEHVIRLGNDKLEIEVGKVPVTIKNGAGAQIDFSNAGDVTITGKNVTIKSDGALTLEGKAEVSVKSTGPFKAEGAVAEVKAQGMGKFEAGGPMAVKGAIVQIN